MNKIQILNLAFWLAVCFGGRLLASEPGPFQVEVKGYGLDRSTVGEGSAAYSLSGIGVEVKRCHWQLGLSRQFFDWSDPAGFVEDTGGKDPWESFTRLQFGFSHSSVISERWMGEVMAGVSSEFEEEMDDSFAAYLGGYGIYQATPRLLLMIGMFYSRHQEIETDFDFVPIVGMAWNPETTHGFSARLGLPVTRARWHFNETTRLVLDLNTLEGGVARLADDSPVRPGGYAERVSASLALRFETRIGDGWDLSAGIGHSLQREIKLYDADGGNEHKEDIEEGMGIEISLSKTF
jgi:hypothetical protein